ncbi:phage tail assembly protein [Roseomonas frigidaquae]|uniref:Phage tail assembly protein n=1 Tax=Falsiroseomonas frigidaquae TaxID=487318 RepID=A0ABX1EW01_9PROT|nr:phage tail assembly protein [Falsiroseomonas frigidaquae]NKE43580.1 phage tail assembly protein [Falsiroseomonas frigidaquae]
MDDLDEDLIEEIPPRVIRFPPVEYNGTTVADITLQPLTIEMIMAAQKQGNEIAQATHLIQRSAGIPPQLVAKLSPKVLEVASRYFARFLPVDPPAAGALPPRA